MQIVVKPGVCLLCTSHVPVPERGRDALFQGPGEASESPQVEADRLLMISGVSSITKHIMVHTWVESLDSQLILKIEKSVHLTHRFKYQMNIKNYPWPVK